MEGEFFVIMPNTTAPTSNKKTTTKPKRKLRNFRVEDHLWEAFSAEAREMGMSTSAYLRYLLTWATCRSLPPKEYVTAMDKVLPTRMATPEEEAAVAEWKKAKASGEKGTIMTPQELFEFLGQE